MTLIFFKCCFIFILCCFSVAHCINLDKDNVYTVNYIPLEDESPNTIDEEDYYYAAAVDYFPVQNRKLSPKERLEKNVDNYIDILRNISANPIDIVVFPEDGLKYGIHNGREDLLAYSTVVTLNASPCDSREAEEFIVRLSCAARKFKVYVSVNLLERAQNVDNAGSWNIYNTNVVFDRNGTVISRYRKFNLFGEHGINVTSKAEVATFTTDFNVKFGVFICFDIFNESPVSDLLELGVKHFIFPSLWFSELHFLTALQMQQMWAYRNNVVLLATGTNYPKSSSGGSGIYLGRYGPLETYFSPEEGTKVLYQRVPKEIPKFRKQKQSYNDVRLDFKDYPFWKLPYNDFVTIPLDFMINSTDFNTVCDKRLCCKFDVRLSKNIKTDEVKEDEQYKYRVMVYSGLRHFPGNTIPAKWIDVCAVIACTTTDLYSCGERYNSVTQSTIFESIFISLQYTPEPSEDITRTVHYPDSLTTEFKPLGTDSFKWNENVTYNIALTKPRSDIFTFGIFGRRYTKDNKSKL